MGISVELDLGYEFTVKAPLKQVFDLVSDVPRSVSHFPKVETLDDLGGGVYRWEMEKVGSAQVNIQTVYASRYICDRKKGSVVWTPVPGQGNALVGGSWKLSATKKGTKLQLRIHGKAEVPLPALMGVVVIPVVQAEFEKLVEAYIDNLIREFGGEV
jgi:carbon monoxide dehydrogenase subunit G